MAAIGGSFPLCLLFLSFSLAAKDVFHEELLLRPLKTGHVYTHFQFTTVWDVDIRDPKACKCQLCKLSGCGFNVKYFLLFAKIDNLLSYVGIEKYLLIFSCLSGFLI